jgi:hypothetical protein
MKSIWNTLSFLAVVNLFAMVIVTAWLWQSGRLTRERAQDIRSMLSTTATQAAGEADRLATEAEAARLLEEAEAAREHPPADSATQITQISMVHQQMVDARRRLDDERRMLTQHIDQATAEMESQSQALHRERTASSGDRATDAQKRGEEQFLRAVRQLEQVPAKQAKKILETLVTGKNVDQAVAYLDAMNPRAAAKVLREFKAEGDIPLATNLLERLRTRGEAEAMSPPTGPSDSSMPPATNASTDPAHGAPTAGDNPEPDHDADATRSAPGRR